MKPDDPRHGTTNGYSNLACRCQPCRDAWTAYLLGRREVRAEQIAPDDPRHGTYSFYVNHKCRCELCREANRVLAAARRTRRTTTV